MNHDIINIKGLNITNEKIISIAVIGSYNTEQWVKNRSDIDIIILLDKRIDVSIEFEIEDELLPILEEYFCYDDIHLTFLYMNEFEEDLALEYVKSNNKLILDDNKEIDFRLYVNKYRRNNEWLEKLIKLDTINKWGDDNGTLL